MPATGTAPSSAPPRHVVTVAVAGMARSYKRWSADEVLTLFRKSSAMLQNRSGRDACAQGAGHMASMPTRLAVTRRDRWRITIWKR